MEIHRGGREGGGGSEGVACVSGGGGVLERVRSMLLLTHKSDEETWKSERNMLDDHEKHIFKLIFQFLFKHTCALLKPVLLANYAFCAA